MLILSEQSALKTNRLYGKNNSIKDVKAHHYIISFEPTDDITNGAGNGI